MVTTRSHDDHRSNEELGTPKALHSTTVQRKRKAQQDSGEMPKESEKKRRRNNATLEEEIPLTDSTMGSNDTNRKARPSTDGETSLGTSLGKTSKEVHERFGSKEIESHLPELDPAETVEAPIQQKSEDIVQSQNDEESEDEAPEIVTAMAGLDQARMIAAKTAKTVKKQEAATKQKRKDRDERLKLQAKLSKNRSASERKLHKTVQNPQDGTDTNDSGHDPKHPELPSGSPNAPLPALLPDSVLSEEPPTTIATPRVNNSIVNPSRNTKRKFLKSKPIKDLKYGSKTIRVLENSSSTLPPCVSKNSKALRDSWLSGQGFVPRRKLGGGFKRKSVS